MTAKEFFDEELSGEPLTEDSVIEGLIMFGKLCANFALIAASEQAKINQKTIKYETSELLSEQITDEVFLTVFRSKESTVHYAITVDKNSILYAYPLDLIK